MRKYLKFFNSVILTLLIISTVIAYHNNDVLESRINTHLKYNIKSDVKSDNSFKEDYYLVQQNKDTTLILTCFAIGFTLFSFFTFKSVEERFVKYVDKIDGKYLEHENNYLSHQKQLRKIESDLNFQMGMLYIDKGKEMLEKNHINEYVMITLTSCEKFCKSYISSEKENDLFLNAVNNILTIQLKMLSDFVDGYDSQIVVENLQYERYKLRIDLIASHVEKENFRLLNNIVSHIKVEL